MKLPSFILPPALAGRSITLCGQDAFYHPQKGDRPGGYLLTGVHEPQNFCRRASLRDSRGNPVVITPVDVNWLEEDSCFVVSELTFARLAAGSSWNQFASTAELIRSLHDSSFTYNTGAVRVAIHQRILQPLMDLTLLFLGLPFVFSSNKRGFFLPVGTCLAVSILFVAAGIGSRWVGTTGLLSPAFAGWLPLMVFVPLAVMFNARLWR